MTEWAQKGCPVCRRQWESGNFPPRIAISVTRHGSLHRCSVCGTLWEQSERFADVISTTDARRYYPDAEGI